MIANFDPLVEMYLAAGWRDVTGDVRYDNGAGIRIDHGQKDATSQVVSQCVLTLDNRTGAYSPSYALGPWYGSIRQNAVVRVGSRVVRDLYVSRAASNGWGAVSTVVPATAAVNWSVSGGVVGDYAVVAGVATHRLTSTAARLSMLPVSLLDCEQRVSVQLPFTVPSGGPVYSSLVFRGSGSPPQWRARMAIQPSGVVQVALVDSTGAGTLTTVAGLTYAGQKVTMAGYMHDGAFRFKVWDASLPEPYAWAKLGFGFGGAATTLTGPVGVESAKDATNSNGTFSISYTDYQVIFREFAGEVSSFEPERDTSGRDLRMAITASGPVRRLRANATGRPALSPATRALSRATGLVAYWPCEDGSNAAGIASIRADWEDAYFASGRPSLASSTKFVASAPLPVIGTANIWMPITPYTVPATNVLVMRHLLYVDASSAEPTDSARLSILYNAGSAAYWYIRYVAGGGIRLQVLDKNFNVLMNSTLGGDINNKRLLVSLELTQNGANVDWQFLYGEIGVAVATVWSGTLASQTIGMGINVELGADLNLNNVTIGHVKVQDVVTTFFEAGNELNAWQGEQAHARAQRITGEQNVYAHIEGGTGSPVSAPMGPQSVSGFMDLFDQGVAADQGLAVESPYEDMLSYVTSAFLENRPVHLTLDYAANQMFDKLPTANDDQLTVNVVTVQQSNGQAAGAGSSVTLTQTTGPNAAVAIESGGIGVYEKQYTINSATANGAADAGGYLLMIGTVDQPRVKSVTLWLHNPRMYAAANMATLLTAMQVDEGKVLSLLNLPRTMANDTLREVVLGYTKRLTQFEYVVTWNVTFGERYQVAVLDSNDSRVDAGAAYLNTTINSSTTSISVKSLDGTLFTTAAADFPFDIRIGGERMTVTNITGSSSPQTFTVTRGANGVSLPHTADNSELAKVYVVSTSVVALT